MTNKDNIERFNADLNQGLSDEQVLLRKKQKLVNKSKKAFGKSYTEIIISNLFSFFNVLLYIIAGVMIYFAVRFNDVKMIFGMFFLIVLLANTIIGLYEDIKARYLLGKLRLITQPKATVIMPSRARAGSLRAGSRGRRCRRSSDKSGAGLPRRRQEAECLLRPS